MLRASGSPPVPPQFDDGRERDGDAIGAGTVVREALVSLRARLALVLAGVLAGPVAAAGLVVGVVVPRAQADAARTALARTATTAAAALAQECVALGDVARATALDLAASAAAGTATPGTGPDAGTAERAAAAALRGHDDAGLVVVVGDAPVARVGAVPAQATGNGPGPDAATLRAQLLASCSRGSAPAAGPAALVESVSVPAVGVAPDAPAVRVVAVRALDAAAAAQLRSRLALDADLAVLPSPGSGAPPAVSDAVRAGRTSGVAGSFRYELAPATDGVPYRLVTWTPVEQGGGVLAVLVAVALAAVIACAVLLSVVASRLTAPLRRLAGAARRLHAGDLSTRTGLAGDDEVGELAAALDDMAGRLQGSQEDLRRSRELQDDATARFGEALEHTHDLDGLLQTVLDAACAAVGAVGGTALLGTERTLEERGSLTPGDGVLPARTAASLGRIARRALSGGRPVTAGPGEAGAPALAVPLRSREHVLGALAVARPPGAPLFADAEAEVLEDLARHAGAAVANALAHEETRRLSVTDPLTGAGNFRQLSTTLAREVERATRFNRPLSVVMLDLDHFKAVNDTHGHPFGDAVLREFARRLQDCLREVDTVTRYGGEEFTVVLPETGADGAAAVAGRIVRAVRDRPFAVGARSAPVTVSAGVAAFPDHGRTASELLRTADAALYTAKGAGRDRWCLAEVAVPGAPGEDDLLDEHFAAADSLPRIGAAPAGTRMGTAGQAAGGTWEGQP
jgi:two-component system cell cycle response regulator